MKKVVASFKYGYLLNAFMKSMLWIIAVCGLVLFVGILAGYVSGELDWMDDVAILIIFCFIGIVIPVVALTILIRDIVVRKKIKLWQDDFVETTASVVNDYASQFDYLRNNSYKFTIRFEVDGINHFCERKYNLVFYKRLGEAYGGVVPIYYSPKYDQVVFIAKQK